jgi:hypothetical protein
MEDNDNELKQKIEESKDLLKLPLDLSEKQYLLKIFPSKDNIFLIFKLEKEKTQTFYYYARFDLKYFKQINKRFTNDNNIYNVFIHLKFMVKDYIYTLEKNQMIMNILFKKNNSSFSFSLRKKIVSQNRLNFELVKEIQENKAKIKLLKKQIAKLDKTIQNKNNIIDSINNSLSQIKTAVDEINLSQNNIENNDSDIKKNNNVKISTSSSKEKNNEDINILKDSNNVSQKENEILKRNLTLMKNYQKSEIELEGKRYISNNKKKKNKNQFKKIKNLFQKEEAPKQDEDDSDTIFCFENVDVFQNKKIYETLIIFNVITVFIIIYLICCIHSLRSNLSSDQFKEQELMKKFEFLSLLNDYQDNDMDGIRENIVDFQLKNDYNSHTNNKRIHFERTKNIEYQEITLLTEEKEKRYLKKHIRRKMPYRVKDLQLQLKYSSSHAKRYKNIYSIFRDISENLILFKTKGGRKFGIFCKNIFNFEQFVNLNNKYSGYVYNDNGEIKELNLNHFFEKYGKYIQNIYNFLININSNGSNRYNNTSQKLLGNVDIFEIYDVKCIK